MYLYFSNSRSYQNEEKSLQNFLAHPVDKWVSISYEVHIITVLFNECSVCVSVVGWSFLHDGDVTVCTKL